MQSPIQTEYIKTLEIPDLTKTLLQPWRMEMKSQDFIFACHQNAQDKSNQIGAQETPADTEIGSDLNSTPNPPLLSQKQKLSAMILLLKPEKSFSIELLKRKH